MINLSNYLFMGIDATDEVSTYKSQQDAGQADTIFLVSMDRVTEEIQVLLIPRDTMTGRLRSSIPVARVLVLRKIILIFSMPMGMVKKKAVTLWKQRYPDCWTVFLFMVAAQ